MVGNKEESETVHVLQDRRLFCFGDPSRPEGKSVLNEGPKGASALTVRQSILPITLVTFVFFMWGFAYGLLTTLNAKFQTALNITAAKAGGLQGAYFGAYFICPLTFSGWIVRKFGYRWTFITGLWLYGVGSLMFWPSAVYRSFAGFCLSLFIVGSGLSTLETAANPYIATCGPPRLSELRLTISQAFQAVGTLAAPLLAARVFFESTQPNDLSKVQWTYVGIACLVFLLAFVFYFSSIPEITDADLALQAEHSSELTGYVDKPMSQQYKLFLGVVAVFCYCGAQTTIAAYFISYAVDSARRLSLSQGSDLYAIAQGIFAIGRFAAAGLMMVIKPRLVLLFFVTMVMLFMAATIAFHGEVGIGMLSLVFFFESCMFPTIFTLSMRGLGRHSKRGSSWMVAAVSGGALFPALTGLLADRHGYHIAMAVPLCGFLVSFISPLYLNLFCVKELDGFRATRLGYEDKDGVIGDPYNGEGYKATIKDEEKGVELVPDGKEGYKASIKDEAKGVEALDGKV